MFGYIKPNIPELKVKDHELYKATYCGLCKTMGKCTGCFSKMTLSYDFAFLALIRMVADNARGEVKLRRCLAHPLKKQPMLEVNDTLKFSARASVILTRLKLKDNVSDSHGFARLGAKIASCVSIFLKKTPKDLLPLQEQINSCINELTDLEKKECDSIDEVASTFGRLLGICASYNYEGATKVIMNEIGFHLGKWIYVIDAIDDLPHDIKKKSYNPLKQNGIMELDEEKKNSLYSATMLELNQMARAVELLDFTQHRDIEAIIKNIVYDGLVNETSKALKLTPN